MEIPSFVFDRLWRSKRATEKYVTKVLLDKVDFVDKKVLDFGCGTGSYCFLFDPDKYLGIDIDENRVKYAKKRYRIYEFQAMNQGGIGLADNNFDYIFIVSTLHHICSGKNREYVRLFHRLLNGEGAVIGMEPCLFPHASFNNWFMKFVDRGKFIRHEADYASLFGDLFSFNVQKRFKRHCLYNEIFYIARKIF